MPAAGPAPRRPTPARDVALALVRQAAGQPQRRRAAAAALSVGALALLRLLARWWSWRRWRAKKRFLQLSTPLEGGVSKLCAPRSWTGGRWWWPQPAPDAWSGFCPSCKRPVDVRLSLPWEPPPPRWDARRKYAYVINLWGASPAYVLGALVLGFSIRKTGTPHALVCLHTVDVPAPFLELLKRIWDCREVQHLEVATPSLSVEGQCERFEKVFTKLHGMRLVEFEKILVMDIDLLVRSNIDELFELQAPAAMRRGMNDSRFPAKHGDPINGRRFFLGKDPSKWSWSVGTGINAGVMLWQPNKYVFDEMMAELVEPNHPSHMKGNGPEQDYLSRFWADAPWTHIGVEYNFQLHQMFFALHPDAVKRAERVKVLEAPESIKIVHYSGVETAKPWHRILDSKWTDYWPDRSKDRLYYEQFAEEFMGHWLWVRKDPATFSRTPQSSDTRGMSVDANGDIWREPYWEEPGAPLEKVDIPEAATRGASDFLESVLREWFDTLQALERELGIDLPQAMRKASAAAAEIGHSGSTGGTDGAAEGEDGTQTRSPGSATGGSGSAAAGARRGGPARLSWDRPPSGWWTERLGDAGSAELPAKATVLCGSIGGRSFVTFAEAGEDVYEASSDDGPLCGVYVKVVGPHSARHFAMPGLGKDGSDEEADATAALEQSVGPIHFWVKGVPRGSVVLLAIVGVPADGVAAALRALAPLGVPKVAPPAGARVLAAAGACTGCGDQPAPPLPEWKQPAGWNSWGNNSWGNGNSEGWRQQKPAPQPAGRRPFDGTWYSTHASPDIAYAAMPHPGR